MRCLWQLPTWPDLRWNDQALLEPLGEARYRQGRLIGQLHALGFEEDPAVEAEALVEEAVTTSAIEGELLPHDAVRSSVARRLGLKHAGMPRPPRHVDGVVEMLLDATARHHEPLTAGRLKGWQAALFPTGYSGISKIVVGDWRVSGPMQVVSGPFERQRVHYEAPPAERVSEEMERFLEWWSTESRGLAGMVRAGVAHLRFETIHPFEDGNGRVGRALVDLALAQAEGQSRRFYSLSSQILEERDAYYRVIERTQKGGGDVTDWLTWFLGCVARAIQRSELAVQSAVTRARFWQHDAAHALNQRQAKVVDRLLQAGQGGFEGGLTNRKYRGTTKASKVTATRDLADLVTRRILVQIGRGRATRYELNWALVR